MKVKSFATFGPDKPLEYYEFDRREPNKTDVEIEILFCGICHSDLHSAHGDWGKIEYPCVPGHEIVGTVTRTGSSVTTFKPGDTVGVGCIVNSSVPAKPVCVDLRTVASTNQLGRTLLRIPWTERIQKVAILR